MAKKIVLAEDDKFISKAYAKGLSDEGIEVITSFDGADAIKKIKSEKPDLVLLDLIMPTKTGFEVLEELKLNKISVPVLILSNLGQESDVKKSKALGAVDYLVKSDNSMDDVLEKIKFHLAKS